MSFNSVQPGTWKYNDLSKTLAGLYYTVDAIIDLLIRANLKPQNFVLQGSSGIIFTLMLKKLELQDNIKQLVQEALKDYPNSKILYDAINNDVSNVIYKSVYDGDAPLLRANLSKAEFEKITDKQITLLPISFLEKGLIRSKCVARIITPDGLGSGFLISENNLLITNNHVISNPPTPGAFKAQFNYQKTISELPDLFEELEIDHTIFYTSEENDWTVVKVKGNPSEKYGFIPLKNVTVQEKSFVNIIQHPGGEYKQIALYHNVVTKVDEKVIQYLTDTLPGSSGSPVFNSNWDVVALHHSGGWFPIVDGSKILCNEGININKIMSELKSLNLI